MLALNRAIEVLTCHFELIGAAGVIEKDAWQTLKSAVLGTTTNNRSDEIAAMIDRLRLYSPERCEQYVYVIGDCIQLLQQLRTVR